MTTLSCDFSGLPDAVARETATMCLICSTAEYCNVTLGQMEGSFRKVIDPTLCDQVSAQTEQPYTAVRLHPDQRMD